MRTQASRTRAEEARHPENLLAQLAQGREWATPGVHGALQRAAAALDTGIESASPRIQAAVRRLAEELAGGVEAATPRIHEGLLRVAPKAGPLVVAPEPSRSGALAAAVSLGVAAWRIARTREEIAPGVETQEARRRNPEDDPESAGALS